MPESGQSPQIGQRLGEGDFPASLNRLNWNTVVWGGLWCIANGAWAWLGMLAGLVVVYASGSFYLRGLGVAAPFTIGILVAYRVAWYAAVIFFAYHANRHVWEHERRRVAAQSDQSVPPPALLVTEFEVNERRWFWIGLAFLAFVTAWGLLLSRSPALFWGELASDLATFIILGGLFVFERVKPGKSSGRS